MIDEDEKRIRGYSRYLIYAESKCIYICDNRADADESFEEAKKLYPKKTITLLVRHDIDGECFNIQLKEALPTEVKTKKRRI